MVAGAAAVTATVGRRCAAVIKLREERFWVVKLHEAKCDQVFLDLSAILLFKTAVGELDKI